MSRKAYRQERPWQYNRQESEIYRSYEKPEKQSVEGTFPKLPGDVFLSAFQHTGF
jgi:hypothetical protein